MIKNTRIYVKDLVPEPDWDSFGENEAAKKLKLNSWSNDLMQTGGEHGVYRQCSLGWHGECSRRENWGPDCECQCRCHVEPRDFDWDIFGEADPIPAEVNRVTDYEEHTWTRHEEGTWRQLGSGRECDTEEMLRRFGPVLEIFEEKS